MTGNDEILTAAQAAKLLQVSTKTLYTWVHIDGLPHLKLSNTIRIHKGQLLDWVKAQATRKEN